MPDAIIIYTMCIYMFIIVLVTIMAYHMGHLRGQVDAMRKELDEDDPTLECDHIYFIYSESPVRSRCYLCKKEHPLNEYEQI